jgi:FKBP-type peptidyl-prolyl cis-trans isomerase FkpA
MNKRILIATGLSLALVFLLSACAENSSDDAAAGAAAPAETAAETAIAQEPESEPATGDPARGDAYLEQRNYTAALKEFDAALALDPKNKELHLKKGMALYNLRRPQEAIPLFDKAVELNTGDKSWSWEPLYHKAIALGFSGDIEGALKSLDASVKLQPNYENLVSRGMAYNALNRPDEALADVRAAMKYKSDDPRLAAVVTNLEGQVAGAKYAQQMAGRKGAQKTPSGLVYIELKKGSGKTPGPENTVKVHYHGTLIDGTVFDSSVERGEPASFPLNRVIPCWTEGVQKMLIGGRAQLVCPPNIAYGNHGAPPHIQPGATLVFEVELLAIE